MTIGLKGTVETTIGVPAPTGRLYANEVLDHAYTRYNVTEGRKRSILCSKSRSTKLVAQRARLINKAMGIWRIRGCLRRCWGVLPSGCCPAW